MVSSSPYCPSEEVVIYDSPPRITETRLYRQLHKLDPSEVSFRRQFRAARCVLSELGACASDLVWRRALLQVDPGTPSSRKGGDDFETQSEVNASFKKSAIYNIAKTWAFSMPNFDSSSRGYNVTPKFSRLVQILKSCESYGESFRGIVFVQRRAIALAIADLLRTSEDHAGFLRLHVVSGHGSSADPRQQQEVFRGFESGVYNLLIATKSVEDLDMPKAPLVIRFDLFESQVSYAYSRACTRGRESHLVHMVERGNDVHRRILSQVTQLDGEMQEWTDALCQSKGSSVPPSTLRETIDPYHSDSNDESDDFIEDPTTRGSIYLQDATTVIYRFAASLQRERAPHPLFNFEENLGGPGPSRAHCTITLPESPIQGISGSHPFSTSHARRAVCFKACRELHKKGFLDYRLFPLPSRTNIREEQQYGAMGDTNEYPSDDKTPPSSTVNVENKTLGAQCYPRKKPEFWVDATLVPITYLYPIVISINYSSDSPHAPMLMLTRRPLPPFENFKVFSSGIPVVVSLKPGAEFSLDDERLHDIYKYTIRVCRTIANKPFICALDSMAYFFAPLGPTWKESPMNRWELPNVVDHIPWDLVSLAARSWVMELRSDDHGSLAKEIEDAVIQDRRGEFTRRYEAIMMRPDLTPLSKPIDSPREANSANFFDYFKARRNDFPGLRNYNQPLIEVLKIYPVLDRLNPASQPSPASMKSTAKYLIPELCFKFTIPASTLRTAMFLPSITRRIDDLLLVKELNAKLFDHAISEHLLHMAVSPPSAGMEYDYERLELLGDAFLKYLSSVYIFVTNPVQKEGAMHFVRQRIISNKSLLHNAIRAGLPPYIQSRPFTTKSWQPPNFVVRQSSAPGITETRKESTEATINTTFDLQKHGQQNQGSFITTGNQGPEKRSKKKNQPDDDMQRLGDKAVADVAEAIIGAAYISGGHEAALRVTKELHIPVENIDCWSDLGRKVLAPPPGVTAKVKPGSIRAVEAIIGHKFGHPHLLAQALTHPGHMSTSYERLEFIGDAILDFMVVRYLFNRHKQLSPGGLTLLKAAMVSNSALAAVCVSSGLQDYILFESDVLANSIQKFADQLKTKQTAEYVLARKEGRPEGQYWLETEAPKALPDVVESIVGAIYISDNFSLVGAEALFEKVMKPFYEQHVTMKTLSHHPTKILFELSQAQGCQQFEIIKERIEAVNRCDVVVHDVILASAVDTTATIATRRASLSALDALEGDAQFLTRTCDCRTRAQTKKAQKKALDRMLSNLADEEAENSTRDD